MKTQSAKAKGRRLQQQIAVDILELYPELHPDDVRSTSMGAHGEDVQLSPVARSKFPYSVEAKNQERLNIWSAIEQGHQNSNGFTALTVFKKNNTKIHVALSWAHFIELLKDKRVMKDNPKQTHDKDTIENIIKQLQLLL